MNKKEFLGTSLHTGLCVLSDCDLDNDDFDEVVLYKSHHYNEEFEDFNETSDLQIPILRPLSDLTKPITHNSETFVPIAKLFKMPDSEVDIVSASEECVQFINKRTRCHYSFYVATMRLTEALKLIEWHFNLMDESEPFIPVTEEFNPYK